MVKQYNNNNIQTFDDALKAAETKHNDIISVSAVDEQQYLVPMKDFTTFLS